jgi:hypothetical protein
MVLAKGWRLRPMIAGFLFVYVVLALSPDHVGLPQVLTREAVRAPTSILGGLVGAILLLTTLDEPVSELPAVSARNVILARVLRMLASSTIAVAVVLLPAPAPERLAVATSVSALIGEGLILAAWSGSSVAWTLPTAHLLAAVTFGATAAGIVSPWAWVIARDVGPAGLLVSVVLFVMGLVLWAPRCDRRAL